MFRTFRERQSIALFALTLLSLTQLALADLDEEVNFDIAAQPMDSALLKFSEQADVQLVVAAKSLEGIESRGVAGRTTAESALTTLLSDTGLRFDQVGNTVTVTNDEASLESTPGKTRPTSSHLMMAQTSAETNEKTENTESPRASETPTDASEDKLEVITVVGTRIKGGRPTSTVVTITQEEMRLAGQNNLGEAIRALPQNFAGGQNPGIGFGATSNSANFTGSSSLNLRGLGADATLTLLNGARLPYDGVIQATDVSVIPTAAIERVEILLDGASALYGSDAVGGVANIVLKRNYEGAELSARYGKATDGGFEQQQYTAVAGMNWDSGGFLVTGDYSKNSAVWAGQRDYLAVLPSQDVTIYPGATAKGALVSGYQSLGDVVEFSLDAYYTDRKAADVGLTSVFFDARRDSVIWGVAPALTFTLPKDWSLKLHGAVGENDNKYRLRAFTTDGVELAAISPVTQYLNETRAGGAEAEGPVFDLPGGAARLSFGAGYREASFEEVHVVAAMTVIEGEAESHNVYGEINLPFISEGQAIPFISSLTLNGALRYESHKNFGDVTTPKIGLIWSVARGFDFKASWGESFKAPTLRQQFESTAVYLYPSFFFPGLPAGTTAFYGGGGSPALDPERAEVITAGFVVKPEFLRDFSLEVGWFDIDYTDRVVQPITNLALILEPAFAAFVTLNPSVAEQDAFFAALGFPVGTFTLNASGAPYDPANVSGIVNNVFSNVTSDHASGVDVIARYSTDAFGGRLALTGNGSWIDATRRLTSASPEIDASGVIFFPAAFKGRFGASWLRDGLTIAGYLNHISGVKNTFVTPNPKGDPMTTVDLIIDYQMEAESLNGIGLNVAVTNLFNEEPPFRQTLADQNFFFPYDSTNYSALGRVVNATVTKRF